MLSLIKRPVREENALAKNVSGIMCEDACSGGIGGGGGGTAASLLSPIKT